MDQAIRYDAFISYRHGGKDEEFAHELLQKLENGGFKVAIDERDFVSTESFLEEMERCVKESRFTVSIISPRYFESGNCIEESIIRKVLDMGGIKKRQLIPLVIEKVEMPTWMYGIVGINFTKQNPLVDPYEKLKKDLGNPL